MTRARDTANALDTFRNRNLIINGAMQVAQRGTSVASSSGSVVRCVDRYRCFARGAGAATFSQTSTVPTGQGFANSLRVDVTTIDSSLDTNDLYMIDQRLEGQDLQQLAKGTSDAKAITASFWVRSTKTGTYILTLFDDDNNRFIAKSYSISSADTWEYKTITFEGDTTGALDNDNNSSFTLRWFLAAGTSYTSGTLATSWGAGVTANQAVGQTNFFDSTSNDFYLTAVQLELGSTATPFEHRSYGDELAACQRYYWQLSQSVHGNYPSWIASAYSTTQMNIQIPFPVTMRSIPTMTYNTGNVNYYRFYRNSANHNFGTVGTDTVTSEHINLYGTATSSHTAGTSGTLQIRLADGAGVFASAEL